MRNEKFENEVGEYVDWICLGTPHSPDLLSGLCTKYGYENVQREIDIQINERNRAQRIIDLQRLGRENENDL